MRRFGSAYTLILLVIVSSTVMIIDRKTQIFYPVRLAGSLFSMPIHEFARVPPMIGTWFVDAFVEPGDLRQKEDRLREQIVILKASLQRLASLEEENLRLRKLLSATQRAADEVMLAELIDISLEPYTQQVLISRGSASGIYLGQPVLDPNGVLGQVTRVGVYRGVVSLLTDAGQSVPVQVSRNGLRCIVHGTGSSAVLEVPYLDRNADIRRGDVLVTSGIGGQFPSGYPVARITEVTIDVNEPFLGVTAEPIAALEQGREVLLVWPGRVERIAPAADDDYTMPAEVLDAG